MGLDSLDPLLCGIRLGFKLGVRTVYLYLMSVMLKVNIMLSLFVEKVVAALVCLKYVKKKLLSLLVILYEKASEDLYDIALTGLYLAFCDGKILKQIEIGSVFSACRLDLFLKCLCSGNGLIVLFPVRIRVDDSLFYI